MCNNVTEITLISDHVYERKWYSSEYNKLIKAELRTHASAKHTDIGSDNGSSPVRRQAIIWSNEYCHIAN